MISDPYMTAKRLAAEIQETATKFNEAAQTRNMRVSIDFAAVRVEEHPRIDWHVDGLYALDIYEITMVVE